MNINNKIDQSIKSIESKESGLFNKNIKLNPKSKEIDILLSDISDKYKRSDENNNSTPYSNSTDSQTYKEHLVDSSHYTIQNKSITPKDVKNVKSISKIVAVRSSEMKRIFNKIKENNN